MVAQAHRPDWQEQAACRGMVDQFIAEDENLIEQKCREATAIAICRNCPVRKPCLEFAVKEEITEGVWGGLSWTERLALCPICYKTKTRPDDLACGPSHTLIRLSELKDIQQSQGEDHRGWSDEVVVNMKVTPSQRTNPNCPVPRGGDHSSASAYVNGGCRCAPAREATLRLRASRKRGTIT